MLRKSENHQLEKETNKARTKKLTYPGIEPTTFTSPFTQCNSCHPLHVGVVVSMLGSESESCRFDSHGSEDFFSKVEALACTGA